MPERQQGEDHPSPENADIYARITALEGRAERAERRLRAAGIASAALAMAVVICEAHGASYAQIGTANVTLNSLSDRLIAAGVRIAALEAKTAPITYSPRTTYPNGKTMLTVPTLTITGCNLQIVDGRGATSDGIDEGTVGKLSGAGNLIVGYNSPQGNGADFRSGSHNLILGDGNSYSAYGGIVAGKGNAIGARSESGSAPAGAAAIAAAGVAAKSSASGKLVGPYASVIGGIANTAAGKAAVVVGGYGNMANGDNGACVVGGGLNTASGETATSLGGQYDTADGMYSVVAGGAFVAQHKELGFSAGGINTNSTAGEGFYHSR